MKQCPYCKKNIPDSAKVCPHCGKPLEKGYKPMKRTNYYSNTMYIILALFLIFSPMLSTFLFGSLLNEQVSETVITSPKEAITLGTLNKANISQEKIEYYFGSLSDFDKLITNSDKYVEKINNFEKDLEAIVNKYSDVKLKKDYNFYVTDHNNIYNELIYTLKSDNNEIILELNYDLSGKSNNVTVDQNTNGLADFEAMKIKEGSYPLFKELVLLVSDSQEYKSFDEASKKFNNLEKSFNERSDSLGNYGLGVSDSDDDSKTSMRILAGNEGYRFRLTCKTELDLDKFV